MSSEMPRQMLQLNARQLEARIQEDIDSLPPELRVPWDKRFEGLRDDQLADFSDELRAHIRKRDTALATSGLHAFEGLQHAVTDPEAIARTIQTIRAIEGRNEYFIGEGRIGHVFEDPEQAGLCHKFIHDFGRYEQWNSIDREASYLERLERLLVEGARTPVLSGAIDTPDLKVISMEYLRAPTIDQIARQRRPLPKDFDLDTFIRRLKHYVGRMHQEYHIYHRDLHAGNVLVGPESTPYVIDFGRATTSVAPDAAYEVYDRAGRRIAILKSDEDRIEELHALLGGSASARGHTVA